MKKITSILIALFVLSGLCFAQTTTTTTTLAAALAANSTTVRLTSATGVTGFTNGQPQTWLFIDREFMPVYSVSGTTAIVQRNGGGMSTLHASGSKVWIGPYNAFLQADPAGSCTATSIGYLPMVSVATGAVWTCGNSQWISFTPYANRLVFGAVLTMAGTIAPTNPIHFVSGATTVTTVTPPPAFNNGNGCIILVPQSAGYLTSVGGNLTKGTTLVTGQQLSLCYNSTTAMWSSSY